jgi:hypothetical protein
MPLVALPLRVGVITREGPQASEALGSLSFAQCGKNCPPRGCALTPSLAKRDDIAHFVKSVSADVDNVVPPDEAGVLHLLKFHPTRSDGIVAIYGSNGRS